MEVADLPYPRLPQFEQYGIDSRQRSIYIGREFLKFRFVDDPDDDGISVKKNYVDSFFEMVSESETPFQQIHVTQATLSEVSVYLHRNCSEIAAEDCLSEALGDGPISVHNTTPDIFSDAVSRFNRASDKSPNFGEYLDYATMMHEDIEYILTWDSDFCAFDNIIMLPHKMWS